jgi:hypothetical protein
MLTATIDHKSKSDILKEIRDVSVGERHTFFSNGIVSAIDVLRALMTNSGNQQTDIMIATWQLGIRDAGNLEVLARSDNINLKILLDVSYKDRNPQYFERVKSSMGKIIWLTSNHTKVMTIGGKNKKFTVLSSANFNRNFRFEFFDITESTELYDMVLQNYEPFFQGKPINVDVNNRPVVRDRFKTIFISDNENNRTIETIFDKDTVLDFELELPEIEWGELR